MQAGPMRRRVAFDRPAGIADGLGGTSIAWAQAHIARAEIVHQRGDETVKAARLAGRAIFRLRIRQCAAARAVTTDWRLRDLHHGASAASTSDPLPGTRYEIREIDSLTDRFWVWLTVEAGGPVAAA